MHNTAAVLVSGLPADIESAGARFQAPCLEADVSHVMREYHGYTSR